MRRDARTTPTRPRGAAVQADLDKVVPEAVEDRQVCASREASGVAIRWAGIAITLVDTGRGEPGASVLARCSHAGTTAQLVRRSRARHWCVPVSTFTLGAVLVVGRVLLGC
jgi:hypothetical protein